MEVLQLVEAALDPVSQGIDVIVDGDLDLAAATRRDHRCDAASLPLFSDVVAIVAAIGQKDFRLGPVGVEERQGTGIVGGLARRDVDGYRPSGTVGAEMNFGRKPTSRAPETLSLSPPLAPAAQWCARMTVLSII